VTGEAPDPDGYEKFKSLASAAIADHGGRYLVRGGRYDRLRVSGAHESSWWSFSPMQPALAFYNSEAYQQTRR
jgi:uncharacterized protein (DUF1330 family)